MACHSISARVCEVSEPTSSVCWSSSGGKIITSVTNGGCAFGYKLYLDIYESNQGEWAQLGWRTGHASPYGDDQEFHTEDKSVRTYRLRLEITGVTAGGTTKFTTPSFTHKG